jgi:phosphogluconate dehydratase
LRQRGTCGRRAAGSDKLRIVAERAPHLAIVSAYNDMLSAHQPYEAYPALIRDEAARRGATVQLAGGVPAMCDGVTQGEPGMELSLFSRDTIAHGDGHRAVARPVRCRAAAGRVRQDRARPADRRSALRPPALRLRARRADGQRACPTSRQVAVRERAAQGLVGRAELLAAERAAYHGVGTCTFYGTANSNQMLLEAMGLHVPGAAFVHPHCRLREALTRAAVAQALAIAGGDAAGPAFTPVGRLVDERVIVNAMVALLATGGSTNHLIHWVAVARAAGILIDWGDFAALSRVTPC